MTYMLFSFRSRTQSMRFRTELKRRGIEASLVGTPREVSLGCGLSVKLSPSDYERAAALQKSLDYNTFLGAFRIVINGGALRAERLYF